MKPGEELQKQLEPLGAKKDAVYQTLVRLQSELDNVVANCIQEKSQAD